jgi:predicted MFS family arabinose efflux permease
MNPLAARLIDLYGWRSTYRIFAVGGSLILVAGIFMMARAPGEAGAAPSRIKEAFGSPTFRKLWVAAFCYATALFIPFVFAVPYAKERGISPVAAATLVGLLGGSSVLSRVGFSWLTNRFGTFRILRFGFALCPIAFVTWLLAGSSFTTLVVFMLIMGVGYGSFVAVSPLVLADVFGVVGLGSLMGLLYTACGLGALLGPPMAGRMIDVSGSYDMPILVALGLGLISFLVLTLFSTTPSGNIDVPGASSPEVLTVGSGVAAGMTSIDETLMELEDWLDR